MAGTIRVGIGGWTYEPWRGIFYPAGLARAKELDFASRRLTSIEINGTYYSTFKPTSWAKWRDDTPDDFVFAVKGSRYCTNRKELAGAGESVARFVGQGLNELGARLGPLNWQLAGTKKFNEEDVEAFLALLPREVAGLPLRHALEVRNPSFKPERFYEPTADFTYARLMRTRDEIDTGYTDAELDGWAKHARTWAERGDVFIYMISGAKHRAPAAAQALIERLR
jgi:uncharacterized protein YecE (DUF72 family)